MELHVTARTVSGKKVRSFRKQNKIPAVIYAKHIKDPISIFFEKNEFMKIYAQAGRSTPVIITWDGINELVLIHEVEVNPVNNFLAHVDFLWVRKDQKVSAEVELIFTGESIIEKDKIGRVAQLLNFINVTAVPLKLPKNITVDISAIKDLQDVIFVKDLEIGKDIEVDNDPDQAVATAVEFKEVIEEEEVIEEVVEGEETADADKEDKK